MNIDELDQVEICQNCECLFYLGREVFVVSDILCKRCKKEKEVIK